MMVSRRYSKDGLCDQCVREGRKPENVPEQYRELFRVARVLLNKDITEEDEVIPTLAFAANSWEMPELVSIRDKFMEVSEGSKAWLELDNQFFYNKYHALKPLKSIDGLSLLSHGFAIIGNAGSPVDRGDLLPRLGARGSTLKFGTIGYVGVG
jgi:hypothetical protein